MKRSIAAIFALIIGLLVPVLPATSAAITKTFTITKSDGSIYAGAQVALLSFTVGSQNGTTVSALSTTNSSGVATITADSNIDYFGFAVVPPIGDFTHAALNEYNSLDKSNQNISAKLKLGNLVVALRNLDGSFANPGSWIHFPATGDYAEMRSAIPVLRSGPFAIDLSSDLSLGEDYLISAEPNNNPGAFFTDYGLRLLTEGGPNDAYSFFTGLDYRTSLTASQEGGISVINFAFQPGNLSGQVLSPTGGTIAVAESATTSISIYASNSDGSPDYGKYVGGANQIQGNGSFDARVNTEVAGKYWPVFAIGGSFSTPSFLGEPFWMNSSGSYANSVSGVFLSPAEYRYRGLSPAANLKLQARQAGSSAPLSSDIQVSEMETSSSGAYFGPGAVPNGAAGFGLSDGAYQVWVNADSAEVAATRFEVMIVSGVPTVRTDVGELIQPQSDGSFNLVLSRTNLSIRLVTPSTPAVTIRSFSADIFEEFEGGGNRYITGNGTGNGLIGLSAPDGDFVLSVNAWTGSFAERRYGLRVLNGVVTLRNLESNSIILPVAGVYVLTPNSPNITGVVKDSSGVIIRTGNNVNIDVALEREVEGSFWEHVSSTNVGMDGSFGLRGVEAGTYRLKAKPNGRSDLAETLSSTFVVTGSGFTLDFPDFKMNKSDFVFRVTAPGSSLGLRYAGGNLLRQSSSNESNFEYLSSFDTGFSGLSGIGFTSAGTYRIELRAPGNLSSSRVAGRYYLVTVTGSPGSYTVTIDGIASTDGVFSLALAVPNVTGLVKRPDGTAINTNNGDWVSLNLQKYSTVSSSWDWTNQWAEVARDGSFGLRLEESGTYRLRLEPHNIPGAAVTSSTEFVVNSSNISNRLIVDFPSLQLATPTAVFSVREPGSSANLRSASIEVRQDGNWVDWITTNQQGRASFAAELDGNYEFIVHPPYNSNFTRQTFSGTVTTVAGVKTLSIEGVTPSAGVFALELQAPNISGFLVDANGVRIAAGDNLPVSVQLQRFVSSEARWDWTNTNTDVKADGSFGLKFNTAGTYRLRFDPWGSIKYSTTFSPEFTIAAGSEPSFSRKFGALELRSPALSGVIVGPTGTVGIANAQVVPVDLATGEELWEYSRSTDRLGRWSLSLPAGRYNLMARAPYQSLIHGDGPLLTGISVNSSGQATVNGATVPAALQLRLSEPTWTGEVVSPLDPTVKLRNVSICLWQSEANSNQSRCANSNSEGKFSLSKWAGFTDFNSSSVLTINPHGYYEFTEARFEGAAAIEAQLGAIVNGLRADDRLIVLKPSLPNVELEFMAGSKAAANVWVSIFDDETGRWLGGRTTDSSGKARINVPSLSTTLRVDAQVRSDAFGGAFTSTKKLYTPTQIAAKTVSAQFVDKIQLDVPNFKAIVYQPGINSSTPGQPAFRAWVDAYNETTNEWFNGSSSNALGETSMSLGVPPSGVVWNYRISVNPPWPNPGLLSRKTFFAQVNTAGEVKVSATEGGFDSHPLILSGGYFPFILNAPNVKGSVKMPVGKGNDGVRDSQVVPVDFTTRWDLWEYGSNTNQLGEFGITLPDGSYYIYAREPWNGNDLARSQQCQINVIGSSVTGPCVSEGQLELKLREPNLKFTLKDSAGNPLLNTHVGVSYGNWHTWANSGSTGEISLLIDSAEIADRNQGIAGNFGLHFNFNPPSNSTTAVSWNCEAGEAKPVCSALPRLVPGQPYLATPLQLGPVTALSPNTAVGVTFPNSEAAPQSWVSLFVHETGYKRWLGSAESNALGIAQFNVPDSLTSDPTKRFSVEVEAPWGQRVAFSRATYESKTYEELTTAKFALGTPNLILTIKQKDGSSPARWSYISAEEVNPSTLAPVKWVAGSGTDRAGIAALALDASKTYRLTIHPGPGSQGSRIDCIFTVDSSSAVTKSIPACGGNGTVTNKSLTLSLSPGNLTGQVFRPGGVVGLNGAIVFAEAFNVESGAAVSGQTREAVTDSLGKYGLDLDPTYDWKIRVFQVNAPGEITPLASVLVPVSVLGTALGAATPSAPITQNFTLSVR
ncbi:carboxypeptidase-like regulatory domain-containing protein [Candidatus Aquiluna sp. UB-MaderosW2red]|uniref:carboxypeptidase-like regulatory domain-containing protein n=1 Tax=Candidatus Aquiluna sp. UB-MaderosW2red TaxID=1855377 RepID=UPI000875CB7F|nr:carboxypeptidase-like regulatory domain-containing protein [Candidatus Aquiluna sp. UB-MaderosW2red]SCX05650.1 hypothetical protein SAMN05216534_0422 [Candidatus Aquiluna sp. UB-MaderosW2red]